MESEPATTIRFLRRATVLLFLLGVLGTGGELLLIGHTEDPWQWTPVVLIGLSLVVLLARIVYPCRGSLIAVRGMMLLFVLSGIVGEWLHYRGNAEFELEMYPTLSGWELFTSSMAGATPVLAPGTMVGLGLLGWISTYRLEAAGTHTRNGGTR